MVSTTERFTDNSPIYPRTPSPVKKPIARKSLCMFTNVLEVKRNLLIVKLEPLNLSPSQLNLEINHGHCACEPAQAHDGDRKSVV